jgi:hypothetical protein
MIKELAFTRKHAGEVYKFYTIKPEYEGETGCLGVEIIPYVQVETPENCLGYSDTILLGHTNTAYTLHRYLPPYILHAIEKQMIRLASTL